jgi:hypothetical protein
MITEQQREIFRRDFERAHSASLLDAVKELRSRDPLMSFGKAFELVYDGSRRFLKTSATLGL